MRARGAGARRVGMAEAIATAVVLIAGAIACQSGGSAAQVATSPAPSPASPSPARPAAPEAAAPAPTTGAPASGAPSGPAAAPSCPAGMARLEGGAFTSKRGGAATVAGLCLDLTEVTVADWKKCVKAGHCTEPDTEAGDTCNWGNSDPAGFKRDRYPINCISAAQAEAYCKAQGKRLPTAHEFEWAQRGGSAGTTYPWGADQLPRRVCARANKNPDFYRAPTSCPVGSCPEGDNPQKIHDLSGNLAEWTASAGSNPGQRLVCGGSTSCEAGGVNKVNPGHAAGSCLDTDGGERLVGVGCRCAR